MPRLCSTRSSCPKYEISIFPLFISISHGCMDVKVIAVARGKNAPFNNGILPIPFIGEPANRNGKNNLPRPEAFHNSNFIFIRCPFTLCKEEQPDRADWSSTTHLQSPEEAQHNRNVYILLLSSEPHADALPILPIIIIVIIIFIHVTKDSCFNIIL